MLAQRAVFVAIVLTAASPAFADPVSPSSDRDRAMNEAIQRCNTLVRDFSKFSKCLDDFVQRFSGDR